jgi:hypothetical protein
LPIERREGLAVKTAAACSAAAVLFCAPTRGCERSAEFVAGNADNRITLRAGADVPRVTCLERIGAASWQGDADEPLIASAAVDGVDTPLHWRIDAKASRSRATAATLVYQNTNPDLRLSWEWIARNAHGPLEHTIRIENRSGHDLWIPLQDSFRFRWTTPSTSLEHVWIDKGAGAAPPVGTHVVAMRDGYDWRGTSSPFAHPRADESREIIPYLSVRATDARAGWYVGIESSARAALTIARRGDALDGSAGLNADRGTFRTHLAPNATFVTPTIFLGANDGDIDGTANTLHRWVRAVLNDPATLRDPAYPLVTNNSWGSAMAISQAQAVRMIDDAHRLGFDMFHLDAGWFRAVGDWHADPQKFPDGIAVLADRAHGLGMQFGLWADWAQAGTGTSSDALRVDDPRVKPWLTTDAPPDWKPAAFKGITIDLGVPSAQAWATMETQRLVRENHLDMLEHDGYVVADGCDGNDHPHAPPDASRIKRYSDDEFPWVESTNDTDVSLHATRAYYAIQSALKHEHPHLLREICNDGGRMVDFGSAAHGDYFSIVDAYDPLSNRQAFFDASHVLPPAMLETYVKEWPTPRIANFRYMLRSGMMGWFTVMIDTNAWTPEQRAAAADEIAFYKKTLRPLIRDADLYHVGARADGRGWDGIEYFDSTRERGVLYAFRGTDAAQQTHSFTLRGIRADARYRLHFTDASQPDRLVAGRKLLDAGVRMTLPQTESSELVTIERR